LFIRADLLHGYGAPPPDCSKYSCLRFRWGMLQPWVSTLPWFLIMSGSRVTPRYYCDVANGVPGCCRNGYTCGDDVNVVCATAGYVPCVGENFCCRKPFPILPPLDTHPFPFVLAAGYRCFRDAAGAAKCRPPDSGPTSMQDTPGSGISSAPKPTKTSSSTGNSAGSINSATSSKTSFNIFGIAPLLGWIGEQFRVGQWYRAESLNDTP
jgi:hypothetical protein